MSLSDDEEALFDDIYGDDDEKEQTKEELETKEEDSSKPDEHTQNPTETENSSDANKDDNSSTAPQLDAESSTGETPSNTVAPPPPPPPAVPPVEESSTPGSANLQTDFSTNPSSSATAVSTALQHKADLSRDAGKMFIGGLDWDTTEDGLKDYFSKYGEVIDHTIMRESSTGRSRGFGFLTFASSRSVDEVVKTQHVLDGKVIDPKRAIPRDEQDKTGKIFVGGIAPEVRPKDFEEFFSKFGTIIDAQLMLDKDTGRSRGFGFVTFDAPDAVDRVCQGRYLDFNGRQIEVKRAEPRGPQQQQNHIQQQQQRYMQQQGYQGQYQGNNNASGGSGGAPGGGALPNVAGGAPGGAQMYGNMTPEAMTQYWQQMQQYWMQFQQQQQQAGGAQMGGMPQNVQNFAQQFQAGQAGQAGQALQAQEVGGNNNGAQPYQASGEQDGANNNNGGYNGYRRRGGAPMNAPRGPRGGGRGRGRGRGGYNRSEYHPYSRN